MCTLNDFNLTINDQKQQEMYENRLCPENFNGIRLENGYTHPNEESIRVEIIKC